MRKIILASIVAFGLSVPTMAMAQDKGSAKTRDYVAAAGQSDAFEMLEADTALAQSADPQVRAFAQHMLQDHTRLAAMLREAAIKSGVTAPSMGVGADQAPLLGALQGLHGPDFDRAYWTHQALAHRSALTTTQLYAANGDDRAIRDAAAAAVPVIAEHLAMAERMQATTGG